MLRFKKEKANLTIHLIVKSGYKLLHLTIVMVEADERPFLALTFSKLFLIIFIILLRCAF